MEKENNDVCVRRNLNLAQQKLANPTPPPIKCYYRSQEELKHRDSSPVKLCY
jgi:hypothetical protein